MIKFPIILNYYIFYQLLQSLREKYPSTEFFSDLYFPALGLNTDRYPVSLRIQSKCGEIWTRKNSVFGQFSRGELYNLPITLMSNTIKGALSGLRQFLATKSRCSVRKGFLRNFAKFTGNHLCQSLFY